MQIVNYSDCNVLIRNEMTGEAIVQTKIIEYNPQRHSIYVRAGNSIEQLAQGRLSLLIFTSDALHIFGGIARRPFIASGVEISMFNGKEYEDRAAKRHPANLDATIEPIDSAGAGGAPSHAFAATVLNLSTSGVLVQTGAHCLEMGKCFLLTLNMGDAPLRIKCMVVRFVTEKQEKDQVVGCKFLSIEA